ncbi:hypothetical protein Tco_1201107 [Tanacetum coccineum]
MRPLHTSPTTSFLSPRIRPLSPRALEVEMRDVASAYYHSLHPSRTPPLLPIPLPAPSSFRRADIPEADMPPQKRLLLTTPETRALEARVTVLETEARPTKWAASQAADDLLFSISCDPGLGLAGASCLDTLEDTGSEFLRLVMIGIDYRVYESRLMRLFEIN